MAKAHTLVDNFNDDTTDTAKWDAYGDTATPADRVREVNGRLEIRPAGGSASSWGGYDSIATYDLTGSAFRVEVVRTLNAADNAATGLAVYPASGHIDLRAAVGWLIASQVIGGSYTEHARAPYDPGAHRWWRLRERDGTTYWETSADCAQWEVLASVPNPTDFTASRARLSAEASGIVASPGVAIFDNFNVDGTSLSRRVEERRRSARDVREEAAELAAARRHDEHANNNDEVSYLGTPLVGNYSKSLRHDALGDPIPASYASLLRALQSEDPGDFEEIVLATGTPVKLTNPQSGLAFDVEGPDAQALTMPPAPRFDSEVTAHEAGELYWMALARDVPFASYGTDPLIAAAVNSLNAEFPAFGGTVPVTAQNVFRGIYPGEQVGPYVSQFLWKGNVDPRKPDGTGRDANEGFITYGAQRITQQVLPAASGVDHLTTFSAWLNVQNGVDTRGQDSFDTTYRFIRSLRDGATYVHFDQVINAYYNAAMILLSEPTGNQLTAVAGTGRPMIDLEFPMDQGNPYDPPGTAMDSRTQVGFGTFGPIHLLQVLTEVLGRAIRAVWWQKWGVHRRLRPEEYGGRVHNHVTGARTYPLHASIVTSLQSGALAPYFGQTGERFPSSYLLPQAYPEGAPTHPAYGAGHATGSGACATILKAFFDETAPIESPVIARGDGLALLAYTGADASQMTVGGELNKLAGNIALFRNAAGVHWRTDYTESLPFGEAIAIRLLQEMSLTFNEDDAFFELTKFDGQKIRIFDGKVVLLEP
ncbi:MAG TPA: vanadium-dependent haloperoxidase [Longimicrobium sp.]|nr:vanadium-dependent haloperoxidase [Longimicrobium sp.]